MGRSAPRAPPPRAPLPAGPTPRWAAGAVGLGHGHGDGDGLGLGDGASAVSRAWGGAEEGGEQGCRSRRLHSAHVLFLVPRPGLHSASASVPWAAGAGTGGGTVSPCARTVGAPFRVPPPPATCSRGFHPGAASVGTLPPSLRCERSKFAEQEAGAWAGGPAFRVWGFVGLGGATRTPRTRHGNGRPAPLPFLRPRPLHSRISARTLSACEGRDCRTEPGLPAVPGWDPHCVRADCPPQQRTQRTVPQSAQGQPRFVPTPTGT